MENRKVFTIAVLASTCCLLALWFFITLPTANSSGKAGVTMLNIGQGDSFLIESPEGHRLLIDGGRDQTVLSELAKRIPPGDHSIDVVIATHPDADHIGGLTAVVQRYQVGLFLTSDVQTDTQTEATLLNTIADKHIPAYYVRRGMTLSFDPTMYFAILFPDRSTRGWAQTNPASVVGRLQIGNTSVLFTGDSPSSIEHFLVQNDPKDLDVDILKLGHHGSKYSSSTEFLKATSPALALISAGVNNRYGHPNPDVLDRLKALSIPWVSTQEHNQVVLTTDGTSWTEEDEK